MPLSLFLVLACSPEAPAPAAPAPAGPGVAAPGPVPVSTAPAPPPPVSTAPAASSGSAVLCTVRQGVEVVHDGPCVFRKEGDNGSFSLTGLALTPIAGVNPISVTMVEPGLAEVRGLTADGINSRWGEARRSASDPACWDGDDFQVCAYDTRASGAPAPGALTSAEWGKEYFVVVLLAEVTGDTTSPGNQAAQKARSLGVPDEAIGSGMDCSTGLTPKGLAVPEDATVVWARFDTQANAQAFADRYGARTVVTAKDTCGG